MRVLLINDYGGRFAGAEIVTLALRAGLRARGHEARLLASRARLLPGENLADDRCLGTTSRLQPLLEAYNPSAAWTLRRVLAAFDPDVVHVTMFLWQLSPSILPLLRDRPAVYHAMTYKAVCPIGTKTLRDGRGCRVPPGRVCLSEGCLTPQSWLARSAQQALWRRWHESFDRIVPVSASVSARLREGGFQVGPTIGLGISESPARPPLSGPPTVGFAGRLSAEKGADVLLTAMPAVFARVSNARLIVAGDGPESGALRRLAKRLGIAGRTRFLGHVERAALEEALAPAWVQVIPSRWDEPFGLVAIEAMMRGTAVVASAAGGLVDSVVDGVTGRLVPPGDPAALADAIVQVLSSREEAESLGAAGRRRALSDFLESSMVDAFTRIYRELLA